MSTRLRGSYALAVLIVLLGLCPDLVLSTSFLPLSTVLSGALGASLAWLQVANGLSNAAFAVGVVVAAQLAQRHRQRPLFLGYAATFMGGSVLAAAAWSTAPFLVGRVLQGGATGMMMISALPPLITQFGVGRLALTAGIVDIGLFGATTLGPLVGGIAAGPWSWRALMWAIAALGALTLVTAYAGYPELDPVDRDVQLDGSALALTATAAVLVFLSTSWLSSTSWSSWRFWAPFVLGLGTLAALVVHQRRRPGALMPVGPLSTQLPVTGTLVAMVAGATFVTAVELVQLYLADVAGSSPSSAGALFWSMPVGLVPAAVLFGVLFTTRYLPYLVNLGLLALVGGCAALLLLSASGTTTVVPWAAALLGFGAGATVAPGLFLAGLGVSSQLLGRAFALVQLLRLVATYSVGPVVLYLSQRQSAPYDGVRIGIWVTLALSVGGLLASLVVPAVSGARPHTPDLEGWLERGERALASPVTAVHLRPGTEDAEAHHLVPSVLRRRRR
ncbi:MAG TPA: MFS transporter [Nocardioides sp.]|uniref:MFS transporter n=1 Tax=Nocardioides sp. TaxID=35761 RepID=UPI002E2EEC15|nr:MFS transporter [Nocardioides sp.]HEX3930759.1 MFS transporter [Nocardioides sp.]